MTFFWCKFGFGKCFGPSWGFLGDASDKDPACQYKRKRKRCRFDPGFQKIPWRRTWQPTPIFLPGESHGQSSLAVYSPWGHKELGTTERLRLPLSLSLALRSALEFLLYPTTELVIARSRIKSTFCRTSQSIWEMVCCYTIKEDDTSVVFLICYQFMRYPLTKLLPISNLLLMQNDSRLVGIEFFSNFSCSWKRIGFDDPLIWSLSVCNCRPLCSSSSRLSFPLQNLLKHHCTVHSLAVSGLMHWWCSNCLHCFMTHFELK